MNVYKVTRAALDSRDISESMKTITFVAASNVVDAIRLSGLVNMNDILSCEMVIASLGEWR